MYVVIKSFGDLQDDGHIYEIGDTYPRKGLKPKKSRIEELIGSENKRKMPLIKEVTTTKKATPLAEEVAEDGEPDGIVQGAEELV